MVELCSSAQPVYSGYCGKLIRHGLNEIVKELPVFLETSLARNRDIYQHLGFEVRDLYFLLHLYVTVRYVGLRIDYFWRKASERRRFPSTEGRETHCYWLYGLYIAQSCTSCLIVYWISAHCCLPMISESAQSFIIAKILRNLFRSGRVFQGIFAIFGYNQFIPHHPERLPLVPQPPCSC